MKNLTGRGGDYQSLPKGERGDDHSPGANPFADSSNDSSSLRSNSSTSNSGSSGNNLKPNALSPTYGATVAPSVVSGSDLDRYPIRRSLMPSSGQGEGADANYLRYSNGASSFDERGSQRTSLTSSLQDENDPFITNSDSSPFGGYPASEFPLHMDEKEADDYLHNPDPIADAADDRKCHRLDRRGWGCLIAFILLIGGFIAVFIILPIIDFTGTKTQIPAPNDGVRLSPYVYSNLGALRTANSLIDDDTPSDAYKHTTIHGDEMDLVFSDEFNQEGRTFYPGDDPVWEAVDIHYQATTDLEWYDPDAAYTEDGVLKIRLDAYESHDLFYRSAMLQSWNKLCFTGGYIEIGARLPGNGTIPGLWPGLWTIGNLARPGYLATSEGVWPYSYNECDAGITPNQSAPDGISQLPGQRLSRCICEEDEQYHPSPGIGRGAPEIDIIEGTVSTPSGLPAVGTASQSLQLAPMDIWWIADYDFIEIANLSVTQMNSWTGGPIQQAVSAATYLNAEWYQMSEKRSFQRFGFEYLADREDGYISWYVGNTPTYTMYSGALSPNGNIGWRDISKEPMSIVMNLGISTSWTYIDWVDLVFPAILEVDYVRIYQSKGNESITCDPDGYPTVDYIAQHPDAYQNSNYTHWSDAGYSWPRNKVAFKC